MCKPNPDDPVMDQLNPILESDIRITNNITLAMGVEHIGDQLLANDWQAITAMVIDASEPNADMMTGIYPLYDPDTVDTPEDDIETASRRYTRFLRPGRTGREQQQAHVRIPPVNTGQPEGLHPTAAGVLTTNMVRPTVVNRYHPEDTPGLGSEAGGEWVRRSQRIANAQQNRDRAGTRTGTARSRTVTEDADPDPEVGTD